MKTNSTRCWAALAMAALPVVAQAAQLDASASALLLAAANRSVTDTTVDGAATMVSRTTSLSLAQFDPTVGVLVSAGASLMPSTAVRVLSVTGSDGTASVDSVLTLGSSSVSGNLNLTGSGVSQDQSWNSLAISSLSTLADYVGTGTVVGQVVTTLSAQRTSAAGEGTTATITTAGGTIGALNNYTAAVSYNYLQHANGSWASDVDNEFQSLNNLTTSATAFSLFALPGTLGAAETTTLDLLSIGCTGACQAFDLNFSTFQDLVAGGQQTGTIAAVQGLGVGSYRSTYTFSLADDSAVGVASSQAANTLTLSVRTVVSAVPDAPALALMCFGGLALLGRRRR